MLGRLAPVLLLAAALAGCTFSRDVVNPEVRDIDTSWIVPGKTTRRDVIARIGFPPHVRELSGVRPDSFRWTTYDTGGWEMAVGYVLTPTFKREHEHFANDILVRFDKDDVVDFVSRTCSEGEGVRILEWKEAK